MCYKLGIYDALGVMWCEVLVCGGVETCFSHKSSEAAQVCVYSKYNISIQYIAQGFINNNFHYKQKIILFILLACKMEELLVHWISKRMCQFELFITVNL